MLLRLGKCYIVPFNYFLGDFLSKSCSQVLITFNSCYVVGQQPSQLHLCRSIRGHLFSLKFKNILYFNITIPPGKPDCNRGALDYQLSRKIKDFCCRIAPKNALLEGRRLLKLFKTTGRIQHLCLTMYIVLVFKQI